MEEQTKNSTTFKVILAILVLALIALFILFFLQRANLNKLIREKDQEKAVLQKELDSVVVEHNKIKLAYGTLSNSLKAKDSVIQANAVEIKKLLDTQWEYNKVRKKLAMLQKVAQGYVHQMDSLYTVNRELQAENEQISKDYKNEQSKNKSLVKDKEELAGKIDQAAILKVYGVNVIPIKLKGGLKEQPTDKASRTDRLKICFTIAENTLLKTGKKIIYVRITRPDNVVVQKTRYDTFVYNGQTIPYSLREDIEFKGQAMNLCVVWTKKDTDKPAMKGKYTIAIISEDKEIGNGSFELK